MRRVVLTVFLVLGGMCLAKAQDSFSVDGFVYEYNGSEKGEVVLVDIEYWRVEDACEKRILHLPDALNYGNERLIVTTVGNKVLSDKGFDSLKELKMPANLRILGNSNIRDMANLQRVDIGEELMGDMGCNFSNLPLLRKLELPSSMEYIGTGSFVNIGVEHITLPDNIKSLWSDIYPTFCNLPSLSRLDLGGIEFVGRGVFNNMPQLKELRCSASLNEIAWEAFSGLGNLSVIYFDKRDGKEFILGGMTFVDCPLLKDVYVEDEVPFNVVWKQEAGGDRCFAPEDYTLHVPEGSVSAFSQSPFWSLFGNIIGDNAGIDQSIMSDDNSWKYEVGNNLLNVWSCGNLEISIVTVDGRPVYSVADAPNEVAIHLTQGIYLMCIGSDIVKFAVR